MAIVLAEHNLHIQQHNYKNQDIMANSTTPNVTVLLYTEAQKKIQQAKTPKVKNIDKNWLNMDDYQTNPEKLGDVKESLEGIFTDINAGKPFTKKYDWEYSTPELRGQYLDVSDSAKSIVPKLQLDLTQTVTDLCIEYGFQISSNDLNVQGFYQKINITKR